MSRRPQTQLVLSPSERAQLEALTLRRKTAQAVALRARIVLGCATGAENKAVAARQRVSEQTVCKWRARFVEHRLDGLLDAPRPGAPRTIDDARVDAVIAKTLESVPSGATPRLFPPKLSKIRICEVFRRGTKAGEPVMVDVVAGFRVQRQAGGPIVVAAGQHEPALHCTAKAQISMS